MKTKTRKLLTYWQQINTFNPISVKDIVRYDQSNSKADHLKSGGYLSLPLESPSGYNAQAFKALIEKVAAKETIEVVVGQVQHDVLYELVNSQLPEDSKIEIVEADNGCSFVYYLKLDSNGRYQEGSLMISEFLRAVCSLFNPGLPQVKAVAEDMPPELLPKDRSIEPEHLAQVLNYIFSSLKIESWQDQLCRQYDRPCWQILLKLLPENQQNSILQMDFYSQDLSMLQEADLDGHFLEDFILSRPVSERHRIDDSAEHLTDLTMPALHSTGKWPSKFNPTLMQKVAINIATGEDHPAIFSVNGPPGTGKTTLLKEIAANAVVQKAKILAQIVSGDSSLQIKKAETNSKDTFSKTYYVLPDELKQYSIVVASNNNAAVENITRDLPLADGVRASAASTDLFDIDLHPEVYFTKLAHEVFNPPKENKNKAGENGNENQEGSIPNEDLEQEDHSLTKVFGLIAAPYGKSANIKAILRVLPEKFEKFENFSWGLSGDKPDVKRACNDFNQALQRFESIRDELSRQVSQFKKVHDLLSDAKANPSGSDPEDLKQAVQQIKQRPLDIDIDIGARKKKLQHLKSTRSIQDRANRFIAKIKSVFSGGEGGASEAEQEISSLSREIEDLGWKRKSVLEQLNGLQQQLFGHEQLKQLQTEHDELAKAAVFQGITVFDEENFRQKVFSEQAQTLCPWVNDELNEANERLFHAALQLTKAYICNSNEIFQNLKRYRALLTPGSDHGYTREEVSLVMREAFHSLNLLIPVLSTTFASVQNAFSCFNKGDLGMVIIDEAGQATPYSALGLLYRSRRCIVVGDPLQVEPIVSTPDTLVRTAYRQMNLLNDEESRFEIAGKTINHASAAVSVQVMADACNPFYGVIGTTQVGCPLVVHRRCQSPMFDISNEISYAERMINKASAPSPDKLFVLTCNQWIDDKGEKTSPKNHYVPSQGERVVELIRKAQENMGDPMKVFEPGKLYVISPFKSVASGVRKAVIAAFGQKSSNTPVLPKDSGAAYPTPKQKGEDPVVKWASSSVGTVHTFQGKEAECVILVLGSDKTAEGAARWAASQANILNVAVTRAKYRLIIIGDVDLWGKQEYFKVARRMLPEEHQVA